MHYLQGIKKWDFLWAREDGLWVFCVPNLLVIFFKILCAFFCFCLFYHLCWVCEKWKWNFFEECERCVCALLKFLGSWTSPNCPKTVPSVPLQPTLALEKLRVSTLLIELSEAWAHFFCFLKAHGCSPAFGLKIARLGGRLLPDLRIGNTGTMVIIKTKDIFPPKPILLVRFPTLTPQMDISDGLSTPII